MERLENVSKDFDKVSKRQKTAAHKSLEITEEIISRLGGFLNEICGEEEEEEEEGGGGEEKKARVEKLKVEMKDKLNKLTAEHKDLHNSIARLGKTMDKTFQVDISKTSNPEAFLGKETIVNEVITQHLFRQGRFRVGETFIHESGLSMEEARREPFMDMYNILEAIKRQDLGPALHWAASRRGLLEKQNSTIEFKLHRLQFLQFLMAGESKTALKYAQNHFPAFSASHMREIQKLMGCFLFLGRLKSSPYCEFLDPIHWNEIGHMFTRDCCSLLGLSYDSPLYVAVTIGCIALPTLLKMANVMSSNHGSKQVWNQKDELPVQIDLPLAHHYHSVFACPVSRSQSTEENPPMLLSCGHVICKESLIKLSKGNRFKCPYCPSEQTPSQAKQVYF